jgi:monoamine oxidase
MQIDRRRFTLGAAGMGLALAMAGCGLGARTRRYDVVILGAGVAGLHAAHLMEKAGYSVAVIEARDRVGGRVFTLEDLPGHPEMGFNSMGAAYGRGLDLVRQLDIGMEEVGARYSFGPQPGLYIGGEHLTVEQWASHPANPFPERFKAMPPSFVGMAVVMQNPPIANWMEWNAAKHAALDIPFSEFLAAQGLNAEAIRLAHDHIPYHGSNATDVSSLMMAYNTGFVQGQIAAGPQSYAITGGNIKLPRAMAARLAGEVFLDMPVASIENSGAGAVVTCRDGSRFEADKVISSIPLPALRNIDLGLDIPAEQAAAIAETPYNAVTIAMLSATEPFWEEDGQSPSMWCDNFVSQVIAQRYGETPEEVTGLMVMARGDLAEQWDEMGREAVTERLLAEFEALRPAAAGKLQPTYFHSWAQEEFTGGTWAYYHPGQATRFPAIIANPAGAVHFCGEHTEFAARGVEGALASAERASLEILAG